MTIAARLKSYGSTTTRIIGVDVARGLAVLGMYGAHIGVFGGFDFADPSTWLDIVHGRSSILFALLAGVSIAIISGRDKPLDGVELVQARVRILVRAALIFAIGGLLEYLATNIAVILPVYAALFVLSLPFLRWSSRKLFLAAGVIAVVMPFVLYTSPEQFLSGDVFVGGGAIVDLLFTGTYPGALWLAFVLAGMGIGRLDLTRLSVQVKLVVVGVALTAVFYTAGILGGIAINGTGSDAPPSSSGSWSSGSGSEGSYESIETIPGSEVPLDDLECDDYQDGSYYCYTSGYSDGVEEEPAFEDPEPGELPVLDYSGLVTIGAHSGSPFEVIGSSGFAMFVLGASLLATRRRVIRWVLYPIACVGAMALTAYSAHIVVIFALGNEFAFAYVDNWLYLWFVLAALVGCTIWTTLRGRGPLERLLTWVSRRTATLVPKPTNPQPITAPQTTETPHD